MASIPWQPRPEGCNEIIWRNTANPIIGRYDIPCSNSIFNSAVVPFKDGYAGVFRADNRRVQMNIFAGFSDDGVHWRINHEPIQFQSFDGAPTDSDYKYDPRVACIDGKYYITWCNGYHGPTIGLGFTEDFRTFYQCENALLPFCRNGVLFPEKINGQYALLSRPSDNGHTPFGDIFVSFSPDMKYWGKHRHVISPTPFEQSAWQCTKVGAGTVPILTEKGWLMFYHGVITTCNGYRYAMGAVLMDKDEPWKVIRRSYDYLLGPAAPYELMGDVQNVVFPCAALTEGDKISIYYGAADTCVCLAHGYISEILDWLNRQHA